jgi:hypothetical protein
MNKQQELEARTNIRTFDGHTDARVDVNSAAEWYIHRNHSPRPGVAPYTHYLTRKGTWESGSTDRWPTMEAAIGFARFGPVTVTVEPEDKELDLEELAAKREYAERDKAELFDFYHDNWDAVIAELRAVRDQLEDIRDRALDYPQ